MTSRLGKFIKTKDSTVPDIVAFTDVYAIPDGYEPTFSSFEGVVTPRVSKDRKVWLDV
jgi:hypothetical protein